MARVTFGLRGWYLPLIFQVLSNVVFVRLFIFPLSKSYIVKLTSYNCSLGSSQHTEAKRFPS